MKPLPFVSSLFILVGCVSVVASPITLLTDSRYRFSDGFAQYQSTNPYLNGSSSINWDMQSSTPFGSMDGYDLNQLPVGYYLGGAGAYVGGMVGLTSQFGDGTLSGTGFVNNSLGVATSGYRASEGDEGYARLAMESHYEITFRLDEAVYYDFSGSMLGDCFLSFVSDNGLCLDGSNTFMYSGLLEAGTYKILASASSFLELGSEGSLQDQKQYSFNFTYAAVPDAGSALILTSIGFAGVWLFARRKGKGMSREVNIKTDL